MEAAVAKKVTQETDPIEAKLEAIKRLLVLQAHRDGRTQSEIGWAIGLKKSAVSNMMRDLPKNAGSNKASA